MIIIDGTNPDSRAQLDLAITEKSPCLLTEVFEHELREHIEKYKNSCEIRSALTTSNAHRILGESPRGQVFEVTFLPR